LLLSLDFALFAAREHVDRALHLALLLAERAKARERGDSQRDDDEHHQQHGLGSLIHR
jgi:hypothetical protein